jgi:hypothetical protein
MRKTFTRLMAAGTLAAAALAAPSAHALPVLGFADVVLSYSDSGAGPFAGPYGGLGGIGGAFPVAVPLSVVLGSDVVGSENFLSLPTGSSITVGFIDETVIDGVGNDIFIREIGASGERAEVYVSKDNVTFVLLGIANDSVTTSFDLASIGFTDAVTAIRIVGLDSLGGSPGFDVVNIEVLPGSIGPGTVSAPGTLALAGLALAGLGLAARRRG